MPYESSLPPLVAASTDPNNFINDNMQNSTAYGANGGPAETPYGQATISSYFNTIANMFQSANETGGAGIPPPPGDITQEYGVPYGPTPQGPPAEVLNAMSGGYGGAPSGSMMQLGPAPMMPPVPRAIGPATAPNYGPRLAGGGPSTFGGSSIGIPGGTLDPRRWLQMRSNGQHIGVPPPPGAPNERLGIPEELPGSMVHNGPGELPNPPMARPIPRPIGPSTAPNPDMAGPTVNVNGQQVPLAAAYQQLNGANINPAFWTQMDQMYGNSYRNGPQAPQAPQGQPGMAYPGNGAPQTGILRPQAQQPQPPQQPQQPAFNAANLQGRRLPVRRTINNIASNSQEIPLVQGIMSAAGIDPTSAFGEFKQFLPRGNRAPQTVF